MAAIKSYHKRGRMGKKGNRFMDENMITRSGRGLKMGWSRLLGGD
jgi:hypothetical protein